MNYGAPSGAGGFGNCGSVEVRIRNAFAKINPEEWKQFDARDYIDSERVLNKDGNPIRFITATVGPNGDTVDLECTEQVLGPRTRYSEATAVSSPGPSGRFGFFRSERYAYDRRVGGAHDIARQVYANHHQMWKRTKREDNSIIPLAERDVRPIVYYLNTTFPDDLKATAVKIGHNWDDVFMEAPGCDWKDRS